MTRSFLGNSAASCLRASLACKTKTCMNVGATGGILPVGSTIACSLARQSGKLHSQLAAYLAFAATAFVCIIAAAMVASHDLPLMLGGF